MANLLQKIWRSFRGTVRGFDSSRQLAFGVVFGMMIGIIPNDSLLVPALVVIAVLSTANLLCVLLSAVVFSCVGTLLDPVTHSLGNTILTHGPLQETFLWLSGLPLVPWTRFENTVVTGSLAISLAAALPVYLIARPVFHRLQPALESGLMQSHFVRWLLGSRREPSEPVVEN
ncbi:MAG: TIGR03546 family protein [Planctomycetota bacterium]